MHGNTQEYLLPAAPPVAPVTAVAVDATGAYRTYRAATTAAGERWLRSTAKGRQSLDLDAAADSWHLAAATSSPSRRRWHLVRALAAVAAADSARRDLGRPWITVAELDANADRAHAAIMAAVAAVTS